MEPSAALLAWILVTWNGDKGDVIGQYTTEKECVQKANALALLINAKNPYKSGCYKLIGGERWSDEIRGTASEHPESSG
ncbi:hypothetical protein D9M68_772580 [compost metagenome]